MLYIIIFFLVILSIFVFATPSNNIPSIEKCDATSDTRTYDCGSSDDVCPNDYVGYSICNYTTTNYCDPDCSDPYGIYYQWSDSSSSGSDPNDGQCCSSSDSCVNSATCYSNSYKYCSSSTQQRECQNNVWQITSCEDQTTDSDSGKDYYTQGTCTDKNGCSGGECQQTSSTDYCQDSNTLVEYYIDSNSCVSETYNCDNNGDLDGHYCDHCDLSTGDIYKFKQDWYCQNNICTNSEASCSDFSVKDTLAKDCSDTATDTDGGKDKETQGTCTNYELCSSTSQTDCPSDAPVSDYCKNGDNTDILIEYFVSNNDCSSEEVSCSSYCENTYGVDYTGSCNSGACNCVYRKNHCSLSTSHSDGDDATDAQYLHSTTDGVTWNVEDCGQDTCTDSDGNDPLTQGTVTDNNACSSGSCLEDKTYTDYCQDSDTLIEYTCNGNDVTNAAGESQSCQTYCQNQGYTYGECVSGEGRCRCWDPCELSSVTLTPHCSANGCVPGDTVDIHATLTGDCSQEQLTHLQVDMDSADGVCKVRFSDGNVKGVWVEGSDINNGGNTIDGTYTFQNDIASGNPCLGKTVSPSASAIRKNGDPDTGEIVGDVLYDSMSGDLTFAECFDKSDCGTDGEDSYTCNNGDIYFNQGATYQCTDNKCSTSGGSSTLQHDCSAEATTDTDAGDDPANFGTVNDIIDCSSDNIETCPSETHDDSCSNQYLTEYYPDGTGYQSKQYDCNQWCIDQGKPSGTCVTDGGGPHCTCDNIPPCGDMDSICPEGDSYGGQQCDYDTCDPDCAGKEYNVYYQDDFSSDTSDGQCCASTNDCVYQSTCYSQDETICKSSTEQLTCSSGVWSKETCSTDSTDTDSGKDHFTQGTCTDNGGCSGNQCAKTEYTDSCQDGNILEEWYVDGTCTKESYNCDAMGDVDGHNCDHCDLSTGNIYRFKQDWFCQTGKCQNSEPNCEDFSVRDTLVKTCSDTATDTDGGKDKETQGTCTNYELCKSTSQTDCPSDDPVSDYCKNGDNTDILIEYFVSNNDCSSEEVSCSSYCENTYGVDYTGSCNSGACNCVYSKNHCSLSTSHSDGDDATDAQYLHSTTDGVTWNVEDCGQDTCTDSDGNDPLTQGTVTDNNACSSGSCLEDKTYTDYCQDSDTLIEYTCNGNDVTNAAGESQSCQTYCHDQQGYTYGECVSGEGRCHCWDPCELSSVTLTPHCSANGCVPGDTVDIHATLTGDCSSQQISHLQVDMDSADGKCHVRFSGADVAGVWLEDSNGNLHNGGNTIDGTFTFQNDIGSGNNCLGETVDPTEAAIRETGNPDTNSNVIEPVLTSSLSGSLTFAECFDKTDCGTDGEDSYTCNNGDIYFNQGTTYQCTNNKCSTSGGTSTLSTDCSEKASTETDNGDDPGNYGVVSDYDDCQIDSGCSNTDYNDKCSDQYTLIEYYANGNSHESKQYNCDDWCAANDPQNPYGTCETDEGGPHCECQPNPPYKCGDLDNICPEDKGEQCNYANCDPDCAGKEYNVYYQDALSSDTSDGQCCSSLDNCVYQSTCYSQDETVCKSTTEQLTCSSGVWDSLSCDVSTTDPDGKDHFTQSTCEEKDGCVGNACQTQSNTDYCLDENTLREYYIDVSSCSYEDYNCDNINQQEGHYCNRCDSGDIHTFRQDWYCSSGICTNSEPTCNDYTIDDGISQSCSDEAIDSDGSDYQTTGYCIDHNKCTDGEYCPSEIKAYDSCQDHTTLLEEISTGNDCSTETVDCSSECPDEGFCFKTRCYCVPSGATCTDSEGSTNFQNTGQYAYDGSTYTDCGLNTCDDPDGGLDYSSSSTVTDYEGCNYGACVEDVKYTDYCRDGDNTDILVEYSCNGNDIGTPVEKSCSEYCQEQGKSSGYCTNGACICEDDCTLSSVTLTTNCGSNGCEPGETVTIDATLAGDCSSQQISHLQIDMKNEDSSCTVKFSDGNVKGVWLEDSNGNLHNGGATIHGDYSFQDDIQSGNPCLGKTVTAYEAAIRDTGNPDSGANIVGPVLYSPEGTLSFVECFVNTDCGIDGTDAYTCSSGQIYLTPGATYTCSIGECSVSGTSTTLYEDCPNKESQETDNGDDPENKGTLTDYLDCSEDNQQACPTETFTDSCNGNTLTEYVKSGNLYTTKTYDCNEYCAESHGTSGTCVDNGDGGFCQCSQPPPNGDWACIMESGNIQEDADCNGACGLGEHVDLHATLLGNCNEATPDLYHLQIDASDGSFCDIQFSGGDLSGIFTQKNDGTFTLTQTDAYRYTLDGKWETPIINADCLGKTVNPTAGAIYFGGDPDDSSTDSSKTSYSYNLTGSVLFEGKNTCSSDDECNDNNQCTVDSCSNNECTFTQITTCSTVSDGCCPEGCTYENDADCEAPTECNDGIDNDGDGLVDGFDCGCVDAEETSESDTELPNKCDGTPRPQCADFKDNDGDGAIDAQDICCYTDDCKYDTYMDAEDRDNCPTWCPLVECADGEDNDNDRMIDWSPNPMEGDCGCYWPGDTNEDDYEWPQKCFKPACMDGADNDTDSYIDWKPSGGDCGCVLPWDYNEEDTLAPTACTFYVCSDTVDNDNDGKIDSYDCGCIGDKDSNEDDDAIPNVCDTVGECNNGIDDDGDGHCDYNGCTINGVYLPPDCGCTDENDVNEANDKNPTSCTEYSECSDGIDNDGDGLIDYPDDCGCTSPDDNDESSDCRPACNNGIDDDLDNYVDLADCGCVDLSDTDESNSNIPNVCDTPNECNNGIDDDGDGHCDYNGCTINGVNLPPDCGCTSPDDSNEYDYKDPTSCAKTECSDGVDNDNNGYCDYNGCTIDGKYYPPDCKCSSASDNTEGYDEQNVCTTQCNNGIDDDQDDYIDFDGNNDDEKIDCGCIGPGDDNELDYVQPTNCILHQCNDGIDNDNDGQCDYTGCTINGLYYPPDTDCANKNDNSESSDVKYQCNDGIDNDGDGLIDYPQDPGCDSETDDDELPKNIYACNNGIDDDHDGKVDAEDCGCTSPYDQSEDNNAEPNRCKKYQCSDGADNDGDNLIDYPNDPGCSSKEDDDESDDPINTQCNDGIDNDNDNYCDYNGCTIAGTYYPPDCSCTSYADDSEESSCPPTTNQCNDGIDNDNDGYCDYDGCTIDGKDYPPDCNCESFVDNDESNGGYCIPECSDRIDNDGDGFIDAEDPGCTDPYDNSELPVNLIKADRPCINDKDDDFDNYIDWNGFQNYDPDCGCVWQWDKFEEDWLMPNNCETPTVPQCSDGIDNDGDGAVDSYDCGCTSPLDNDESDAGNCPTLPECSDGIDNDGDGLTDAYDCGCVNGYDNSEDNSLAPNQCDNPIPPECADMIDNDGDGFIDAEDCGCTNAWDRNENDDEEPNRCLNFVPPECSDTKDNDHDGSIDAADCGCVYPYDNDESDDIDPNRCTGFTAPECSDGIDNDGDGLADYLDTDRDGLVDYGNDCDCIWYWDMSESGPGCPQCYDKKDNDGDGCMDMNDRDCQDINGYNYQLDENDDSSGCLTSCNNGFDDDHDHCADEYDPDCYSDFNGNNVPTSYDPNNNEENTEGKCIVGRDIYAMSEDEYHEVYSGYYSTTNGDNMNSNQYYGFVYNKENAPVYDCIKRLNIGEDPSRCVGYHGYGYDENGNYDADEKVYNDGTSSLQDVDDTHEMGDGNEQTTSNIDESQPSYVSDYSDDTYEDLPPGCKKDIVDEGCKMVAEMLDCSNTNDYCAEELYYSPVEICGKGYGNYNSYTYKCQQCIEKTDYTKNGIIKKCLLQCSLPAGLNDDESATQYLYDLYNTLYSNLNQDYGLITKESYDLFYGDDNHQQVHSEYNFLNGFKYPFGNDEEIKREVEGETILYNSDAYKQAVQIIAKLILDGNLDPNSEITNEQVISTGVVTDGNGNSASLPNEVPRKQESQLTIEELNRFYKDLKRMIPQSYCINYYKETDKENCYFSKLHYDYKSPDCPSAYDDNDILFTRQDEEIAPEIYFSDYLESKHKVGNGYSIMEPNEGDKALCDLRAMKYNDACVYNGVCYEIGDVIIMDEVPVVCKK